MSTSTCERRRAGDAQHSVASLLGLRGKQPTHRHARGRRTSGSCAAAVDMLAALPGPFNIAESRPLAKLLATLRV